MSMQDVNIEFEVPTPPEMDVSLEIVTNGTEWGNIQGDIADQTDLIDLIDTKIEIEATARENNDLTLQNGINTLNNDLTAEISNRGTADGILQDNIDTLSGTVTSNYNTLDGKITDEATARGNADSTLDGKIGDNKTAIDNHIADKTNPHEVSKSQVGLGNVDNTSDLNKPISTATQNALNTKVSNTREINGYSLSSDINLTASDVDALPDTTTINDLTTAEQQSALNSGATSTNIGQIATNTQNISNEVTNRQNADNALQSQIDALVVSSDVFDVVGTYADLQAYDISTVPVNDIIKVLVDSTHDNAATYYRCVENDNVKSWSYIGAEGAYYTKSEADNRFVEQTTTINGQALSNNITLDAEDVGALPDSTTIGNGTLTIQKNGSTIDSFGANDTGNTTVNITVPTDTGDLTNNAGYIKDINSTDVINALGYTPYDNTNPDGYTNNVGTVTSVNNETPDSNGNVTLSIPAAQVNSDWAETDTSSKAYIENKPTLSTVATTGDYDDLLNKPTIPTVGNGTITITQGGVTKGTFTTNQSGNTSIDLDAGGGSSTDVQINGTSITSGGVADILTNTAYDSTTNKIATMSDVPAVGNGLLTITENFGTVGVFSANSTADNTINITVPTKTSDLTNDSGFITGITGSDVTTALGYTPYNSSNPSGYTSNTGTVTSVNNVQPDSSGNVSLTIPTVDQSFDGTSINAESGVSILGLLQTIYPVGSVYLSTNATCPLASLFGTWTLVSSGRALWTGYGSNGGSTISAGLPNIIGTIQRPSFKNNDTPDGAFLKESTSSGNGGRFPGDSGGNWYAYYTSFDASRCSYIYGNSTTVQPPAYVVNVWRRTA